jgi:hypothetical protein
MMAYSLESLVQAARRAKDVAVLIDAARVLTFMAKSRAREAALEPGAYSPDEIGSIYCTASELTGVGRQLVAEADMLLATARQPRVTELECYVPGASDDLDALRDALVASMDDALHAIEMLESIQELGAEDIDGVLLDTPAGRAQRETVQALLARLRR